MDTTVVLVTVAVEDLVRNRMTPVVRIEERPAIAWHEAPDGTLEPRCAGRIPAGTDRFIRHPNGLIEALNEEEPVGTDCILEDLIAHCVRPDCSKPEIPISLIALTSAVESARMHALFQHHLTPKYRRAIEARIHLSANIGRADQAMTQEALSTRRARFA